MHVLNVKYLKSSRSNDDDDVSAKISRTWDRGMLCCIVTEETIACPCPGPVTCPHLTLVTMSPSLSRSHAACDKSWRGGVWWEHCLDFDLFVRDTVKTKLPMNEGVCFPASPRFNITMHWVTWLIPVSRRGEKAGQWKSGPNTNHHSSTQLCYEEHLGNPTCVYVCMCTHFEWSV